MRRSCLGVVAGVLLALTLSAPASAAADPITFTFKDGCGFVDTTVTNTTTEPVQYQLATIISGSPTALGRLDFTLAGGATRTHRWLMRFHHGVRATSPALAASVDHNYGGECQALWSQPVMREDCSGQVLASVGAITQDGLGEPTFAVNNRPRQSFPPTAPHVELIDGLRPGDVVSFRVPALTEPHEPVTWYQRIVPDAQRCAGMPPVTAESTCAGVKVRTVNTGTEPRDLQIVSPVEKNFTLAAGQAADETMSAENGEPVVIYWGPVGFETGELPAAILGIYAKPANCETPSGNGGSLPITGSPLWLVASAGGLLLLLGAALFTLTRKRRGEPAA